MIDPDKRLISRHDPSISMALLTRLPVRVNIDLASARGARAAWAYPLVGAILGVAVGLMTFGLQYVGAPPALIAAFALVMLIVATGALHEDGLADSIDGFWGGWTRERRLEIMKDSHIGTYGVLGLVLSSMIRWAALTSLLTHGSIVAVLAATLAISRASMVVLWSSTTSARTRGVASGIGRPELPTAVLASSIALLLSISLLGLVAALSCALVALACTLIWRTISMRKIGGHTGDVLGASEQICQCAILALLAILAPQT